MQRVDGRMLYSATDVARFLECEHLSALDVLALDDKAMRESRSELDESAELYARKGEAHERAYLDRLREGGLEVVEVASERGDIEELAAVTLASMRRGVAIIYQATLRQGSLVGHADFLRRIDNHPSALGAWSYEVVDTKLARSPKAKFLVQLAFYSELLAWTQGVEPTHMHVLLGDFEERSYRCVEYARYFQALLSRFLAHVGAVAADTPLSTEPLLCRYCDLCHWRENCEATRAAADHLCQIAGITKLQMSKLRAAGVRTMGALVALHEHEVIARMQPETLAKLRSQAALQHAAKVSGERSHLLLPLDAEGRRGFHRLPAPDAGDVFFDMEGDPLEDGGLEYLFGFGYADAGVWTFRALWGHDRGEERTAFEAFVDFVEAWRCEHPGLHIYHYANYEAAALKRLASLHGTCEAVIDDWLRQGVLVDLYKVVREALRISEDSYSIKAVERFYRPPRAGSVQNAGASIVAYERWRESGDESLLLEIEAYNRDDVESTAQLRDWLLALRPNELEWAGNVAAAMEPDDDASDARSKRVVAIESRLSEYRRYLVDPLPADRLSWTPEHHMRELAWQLLDFHRRAEKPWWWAYYERMSQDEAELKEDVECLAGLTADPERPPERENRSIRYHYRVPEQESRLDDGDECVRTDTGKSLAGLRFDRDAGRVSVKIAITAGLLPDRLHLGPGMPPKTEALTAALYRFADSLLTGTGRYPALEGLLRHEAPRLVNHVPGAGVIAPGVDLLDGSILASRAMDRTLLYVQGPPGAGKTHIGARVIVDLLRRGKRVGIMSNSHKAINHLLGKVVELALEKGVPLQACKKCGRGGSGAFEGDWVQNVTDNADVWGGPWNLVAGTAWLFAHEGGDQQLDVLCVDEAGQVSLANLVAAATSARNLVLLGDQMQLAQPIQGVHPGRSGDSALDWLLDGAATIAPDRGIFLAKSWRMHPSAASSPKRSTTGDSSPKRRTLTSAWCSTGTRIRC